MADPNIWSHEYASGQSSTDFPFPSDAQWIQAVGPGTIDLVFLDAYVVYKKKLLTS